MTKKEFFNGTLFFHRQIAKKFGMELYLKHDNYIETQPMLYDTVANTIKDKYLYYYDYCRYRAFELVVEEIRKQYTDVELKQMCVAEAGVNRGDFAWIINERFPESRLYLYDTFESFAEKDIALEVESGFTDRDYMQDIANEFGKASMSSDKRIESVKVKMPNFSQCIFRKGYFPETAVNENDKKWIFVSLDMDLYYPILNGILFFWPNLQQGGYIFVHDYNNKGFKGVKKALAEAEQQLGVVIPSFPLPDQGGTVVLKKI